VLGEQTIPLTFPVPRASVYTPEVAVRVVPALFLITTEIVPSEALVTTAE
jgi:hypothetical protein